MSAPRRCSVNTAMRCCTSSGLPTARLQNCAMRAWSDPRPNAYEKSSPMYYDPRTQKHGLRHSPITALVVPRPIGWISTISPEGVVNLAPYSYFDLCASQPPFVMFASNTRKHSQNYAQSGGEFVFNLATYELRTEMNISGGDYPEGVSEPELAKLEMAPSRLVKPPRVAKSPIALECVYSQTVSLKSGNGKTLKYEVVLSEGVNVHVDDAVIGDGM